MTAPGESPAGRAWLPASTGLPSHRPPTRREAFEVWLRQARGVHAMTCATRAPAGSLRRNMTALLLVQAVIALAFAAGFVLAPSDSHGGIAIALHVVAAAMLLIMLLGSAASMMQDTVAEVAARSGRTWASSPLPTSAWVAGKVAYYLEVQALLLLAFLPTAAASSAMGGIRLTEIAIVLAVAVAWTCVTGVAVAAAALDSRAQVAAARVLAARGMRFGRGMATGMGGRGQVPPAAAIVVVQMALGFGAAMVLAPLAFSGKSLSALPVPASLALTALATASPMGAALTAFLPSLRVDVFGASLSPWVLSLVIVLAAAPVSIAVARLSWRAPDGSRGMGVRPGAWLLITVLGLLVAGIAARSPTGALVVASAIPAAGGFFASLRAGGTRLPDLAAGRVTGWRRIVGLDRATAAWHGIIVMGLLTLACSLGAPVASFGMPAIGAAALIALCAVPWCVFGAAMGREGRRVMARFEAGVKDRAGRPVSWLFALVVVATFAGSIAGGLARLGFAPAARVVEMGAFINPVPVVVSVTRLLSGQASAGPFDLPGWLGPIAIPLALAVQIALAVLAHRLDARAAAKDDLGPLPPVAE